MARPLAVIGITYFLALLTANLVGNPVSALLSALLFLFFSPGSVFSLPAGARRADGGPAGGRCRLLRLRLL